MSVRTELRDAVRLILDDRYEVPDEPAVPPASSASRRWVVTVEQANVKPGPSQGTLTHELHLMLVVLTQDAELVETELEDALEYLLEQLLRSSFDHGFVSADRDVVNNLHAYDLTLTIASDVTDTTKE